LALSPVIKPCEVLMITRPRPRLTTGISVALT